MTILYVLGFAFVLACLGALQVMKYIEEGEVAPVRAWKWFIAVALGWPLLFVLFLVACVGDAILPKRPVRRGSRPRP